MKTIYWIDRSDKLIRASDLASMGLKQTDPLDENYVETVNQDNYAWRINSIRVHVCACDGDFAKTFSSVGAASQYCKDMGFDGDGGVCDHGCSRFGGAEYRMVSKTWYACPRDIESRIGNGSLAETTPEVNTDHYQFAHGRKPAGRGSWAFHPDKNVDATSKEIFWATGLYSEAKRAAQNHFKGQTTIYPLT